MAVFACLVKGIIGGWASTSSQKLMSVSRPRDLKLGVGLDPPD
jgi:hypothetical protein